MLKKPGIPIILPIAIFAVYVYLLAPLTVPTDDPEPKRTPSSGRALTGRQVTVLTNPPHLKSAEIPDPWLKKKTGAVVRNGPADHDRAPYAIRTISARSHNTPRSAP